MLIMKTTAKETFVHFLGCHVVLTQFIRSYTIPLKINSDLFKCVFKCSTKLLSFKSGFLTWYQAGMHCEHIHY